MSESFDDDLARLDQIRRSHKSARPTHDNPRCVVKPFFAEAR